nr:MAG TPA: hypothetical protein [Caudoviricetes sp.]
MPLNIALRASNFKACQFSVLKTLKFFVVVIVVKFYLLIFDLLLHCKDST